MDEHLEGWICLGGDCIPSIELLEGEDAQLLQQVHRIVDYLRRGVRVLCQNLDFLALLDPVE